VNDFLVQWRVLASELRDEIRQGGLAAGERLPSEEVLVQRTGLSRTSVRRAVEQLKTEGLVETRAPMGAFVVGLAGPVPLCCGESVTSSAALVMTRGDGSTVTYPAGTAVFAPV
jgi:GntR family transcriptional repressor for pyruvate dehydrogenase complex